MFISNTHVESYLESLEYDKVYALKPKEIKPTGFEGNPYTGINADIPLKSAGNYLQIHYSDANPDGTMPDDMDPSKRSTLVIPVKDNPANATKAYVFKGFISALDARRWYRHKFKQPDDTPGFTPPEEKKG